MSEQVPVLGGGSLSVPDYAAFLAEEYLAGYLPGGGAAVKLAVAGSPETASRLGRALGAAADAAGSLFVAVSAEEVRVSQIEQLFFAVSRAVDWDALAAAVVRSAYEAVAFPAPGGLAVAEVARAHDVDVRELYRSVRRQLEHSLLGDDRLARELRRAVLRLAQVHLGGADVDRAEHEAVLGWLRGEKVPLAALRPALIYARIGRHNARSLLGSLTRLMLDAGQRGLVLTVDLARLAESRRPPVEQRTGVYYSKAAVLDAFEVLRQLIDATDELRGVLVVAVVPPELVTDESRGLPAYTALQLRVADEVRDRRRANPFAALVRLEVRLEAVA
ncbi:MAG TPA: BREX system ATP-binding domain-containing protein [Mycobacteriales bacterium]|nr:BREX system ATP-binding domain-containing protein [Mycobacteriales bacterium]